MPLHTQNYTSIVHEIHVNWECVYMALAIRVVTGVYLSCSMQGQGRLLLIQGRPQTSPPGKKAWIHLQLPLYWCPAKKRGELRAIVHKTLYIIHVFTFDYKKTCIFVDETVIQKYMYNITDCLSIYQLRILVFFKTICNKKSELKEWVTVNWLLKSLILFFNQFHALCKMSLNSKTWSFNTNTDTVKSKIQVKNALLGLYKKFLKLNTAHK